MANTNATTTSSPDPLNDEWVDLNWVKNHYKVGPDCIYRNVELGHLRAYKVGKFLRFRKSDVEAWARPVVQDA